jgi:PAS domain-containing protein
MSTLDREKFKLVQKISRFGIWHWNLKVDSPTWDDRLFEIYGISAHLSGVTNKKWADLLDPVDLNQVEQSARCLITGNADHFDHVFRARKADGTPLWVRTVARLFRNQEGDPEEIFGANYDFTEKFTNEKSFETLKARLELIAEEHDFGFWEWHPTQKTLIWDESMVRIWGHPPKASPFDQGVAGMWEGVHPEDQPLFQSLWQAMMGSMKSGGCTFRIVRPDSEVRFVKMRARVLGEGDHHDNRLMGFCQDVTELLMKDKGTVPLNEIDTQKARPASIERLAGEIGHDINNSLAIILGFTQKMMGEISRPHLKEEKALPWLQKIYKAGLRIKDIIDGLKDLDHSMDLIQDFKLPLEKAEPPLVAPILVVVVTNDSEQQQKIFDYFTKAQCQIKAFTSSAMALAFLSTATHVDLIVVDSKHRDRDGFSLIVQINEKGFASKALKIVLGEDDRDTLENAAQDFRFGMVDGVLEKPVSEKDLDKLVYRIAHRDHTKSKVI